MDSKNKLNFIIDALMFLCMAALAGVGFLLKHFSAVAKKAVAMHGKDITVSILGLRRQAWGEIHLIVSIVFIALLIIHILLHWEWIVRVYKTIIKNKFAGFIAALLFLIITAALLLFPYFINPEIRQKNDAKEPSGHSCITLPGGAKCAVCGPECKGKVK